MARIERFEEIEAWQDARTLVKRIYEQLYAVADLGYVTTQQTDELNALVETVSRRIAGFIKYLKPSA